jgi:F420-dependent oxidoreductase-like protein
MLDTWIRADGVELLESAWVFDHFYPIHGDSDGPCLEGWTSLAALAQATSRIKVGSMVNGMPYRHPAVTANMASTTDIISGGRLQLGLGAGWNKEESNAYGITLGENLTERFDRFDECVEIIVGMLENEETTFDGKYFTVTNARNEPKGPQRPKPPIVIGGSGEKRTLRTVARFADHWNAGMLTRVDFPHKLEVLKGHCADVGRDPSDIMTSIMVPFDPTDIGTAEERLRSVRDMGVDCAIFNLPSPHDPDNVDRVAELASKIG